MGLGHLEGPPTHGSLPGMGPAPGFGVLSALPCANTIPQGRPVLRSVLVPVLPRSLRLCLLCQVQSLFSRVRCCCLGCSSKRPRPGSHLPPGTFPGPGRAGSPTREPAGHVSWGLC